MTVSDVLVGLLLAFGALYVLGLPLAWLLPAPEHSTWVLRIAAAPLYAIVLAYLGAAVLGLLGIPLHPLQLVLAILAAWGVAWSRSRHAWGLRTAMRGATGPGLMVGLSGALWALSLVGFGPYLPNRDFKNHAYLVAQVAWTRSADPNLVLRVSPISGPEEISFYPLGLHTLLGWVLPSPTFGSVAVTAAAAVLVTSISMPLALVALARAWDRSSRLLWLAAGFSGVLFVGLSGGFLLGSVVLLVATGLYASALAVSWHWLKQPSVGAAVSMAICAAGLFFLHVAEAVGLLLVVLACLQGLARGQSRAGMRRWVVVSALLFGIAVGVVAIGVLRRLLLLLADGGFVWDLQPNTENPAVATIVGMAQEPGGNGWGRAVWVLLALVGFWVAARRHMSAVPLMAFLVPVVIGAVAGMRATPGWLNLLTAPWYGSAGRVGVMAMAPVALAGSMSLVQLHRVAQARGLRWVSGAVAMTCAAALAVQVAPLRRAALATHLAGAGDTALVARELRAQLEPGQTVVTFDGDGTANLFAFARVPVTAGLGQVPAVGAVPDGAVEPLIDRLLRLDDPQVRRQLADLGVAFIAVGTTSRYWGQETGYLWQALAAQPELNVARIGTDMIVLRYQAGGPS